MAPACCHGRVHFNPYGGRAAELAAALVNERATADATALERVLAEHGTHEPRLTRREADTLLAWGRRLRPVFERAAPIGTRVALVNELLAEAASRPFVSCHDGRAPHLHYAAESDDTARRAMAHTAAGIAVALCEDAGRLGACDRDGCDTVYVDTSRNGRRRFCSPRCANRWHVARSRARAA